VQVEAGQDRRVHGLDEQRADAADEGGRVGVDRPDRRAGAEPAVVARLAHPADPGRDAVGVAGQQGADDGAGRSRHAAGLPVLDGTVTSVLPRRADPDAAGQRAVDRVQQEVVPGRS
jgi:hypothetical protein